MSRKLVAVAIVLTLAVGMTACKEKTLSEGISDTTKKAERDVPEMSQDIGNAAQDTAKDAKETAEDAVEK